ncbi:MAG: ATP phosphoribosyltransferase [Phycisphaeraceae bacterium]|nr:MAG: ATP phosphoribosyltransferase [Phycisphaeraceae bacterium]
MTPLASTETVRFAIPKGRMYDHVVRLLADAGIAVSASARDYRPTIAFDAFEVKVLKPRAIIEMLEAGSRDLGFAGADWVAESNADLVELLDTRLDPVRLIAAAPESILEDGRLPSRPLVIASEYGELTNRWIARRGLDATLLRSYGATEVLPPEDADCIVDNTASGATLAANGLIIIDELMRSSTRLYASRTAMDCPIKRDAIERFVMVVGAVLQARKRVMVEVNVSADVLDAVVAALPCMREPTISPLRSSTGYAVKAAVPRNELARVIPAIKRAGGTDIVVTTPEQIVP